jgi:hypothetical protein
LVEGRVFFGSLVSSVAVVILIVILGLRYLNGTLGGSYALGSLLLSLAFAAVIAVVLILSMTDWLRLGRPEVEGEPSGGVSAHRGAPGRRFPTNISLGGYNFYNSGRAALA